MDLLRLYLPGLWTLIGSSVGGRDPWRGKYRGRDDCWLVAVSVVEPAEESVKELNIVELTMNNPNKRNFI